MFLINARVILLATFHIFFFKIDFIIQWKMSFSKQKSKRLAMSS